MVYSYKLLYTAFVGANVCVRAIKSEGRFYHANADSSMLAYIHVEKYRGGGLDLPTMVPVPLNYIHIMIVLYLQSYEPWKVQQLLPVSVGS